MWIEHNCSGARNRISKNNKSVLQVDKNRAFFITNLIPDIQAEEWGKNIRFSSDMWEGLYNNIALNFFTIKSYIKINISNVCEEKAWLHNLNSPSTNMI